MNGKILQILLVEDNDDHAELIKRSFESHRVANNITWLTDGEQAIDYLFNICEKKPEKLPHLILLDLRLPKVDGIEVLKRVKTNDAIKMIPIVILTSSEAEKDISKAYINYANSYIVKPLDFHKFTQVMKELGFYWLAWNQKPF